MKLLTLKEVTNRTTLSRRTLYRMIEKGIIGIEDTFTVGFKKRKRVITEQWVEQFIQDQKT